MPRKRQARCAAGRVFVITGVDESKRILLGKNIQTLGGVYSKTDNFQSNCTHVICGQLSRSEKFLGALTLGRWVVRPDYISSSVDAGRWLDEVDFEWSSLDAGQGHSRILALAAKRNRWRVSNSTDKVFAGWQAAVVMTDTKRQNVYKRLLGFGGARVCEVKLPVKDGWRYSERLTYLFVDADHAPLTQSLQDVGVMCLNADFISDFVILHPPPEPTDYYMQAREDRAEADAGTSRGTSPRPSDHTAQAGPSTAKDSVEEMGDDGGGDMLLISQCAPSQRILSQTGHSSVSSQLKDISSKTDERCDVSNLSTDDEAPFVHTASAPQTGGENRNSCPSSQRKVTQCVLLNDGTDEDDEVTFLHKKSSAPQADTNGRQSSETKATPSVPLRRSTDAEGTFLHENSATQANNRPSSERKAKPFVGPLFGCPAPETKLDPKPQCSKDSRDDHFLLDHPTPDSGADSPRVPKSTDNRRGMAAEEMGCKTPERCSVYRSGLMRKTTLTLSADSQLEQLPCPVILGLRLSSTSTRTRPTEAAAATSGTTTTSATAATTTSVSTTAATTTSVSTTAATTTSVSTTAATTTSVSTTAATTTAVSTTAPTSSAVSATAATTTAVSTTAPTSSAVSATAATTTAVSATAPTSSAVSATAATTTAVSATAAANQRKDVSSCVVCLSPLQLRPLPTASVSISSSAGESNGERCDGCDISVSSSSTSAAAAVSTGTVVASSSKRAGRGKHSDSNAITALSSSAPSSLSVAASSAERAGKKGDPAVVSVSSASSASSSSSLSTIAPTSSRKRKPGEERAITVSDYRKEMKSLRKDVLKGRGRKQSLVSPADKKSQRSLRDWFSPSGKENDDKEEAKVAVRRELEGQYASLKESVKGVVTQEVSGVSKKSTESVSHLNAPSTSKQDGVAQSRDSTDVLNITSMPTVKSPTVSATESSGHRNSKSVSSQMEFCLDPPSSSQSGRVLDTTSLMPDSSSKLISLAATTSSESPVKLVRSAGETLRAKRICSGKESLSEPKAKRVCSSSSKPADETLPETKAKHVILSAPTAKPAGQIYSSTDKSADETCHVSKPPHACSTSVTAKAGGRSTVMEEVLSARSQNARSGKRARTQTQRMSSFLSSLVRKRTSSQASDGTTSQEDKSSDEASSSSVKETPSQSVPPLPKRAKTVRGLSQKLAVQNLLHSSGSVCDPVKKVEGVICDPHSAKKAEEAGLSDPPPEKKMEGDVLDTHSVTRAVEDVGESSKQPQSHDDSARASVKLKPAATNPTALSSKAPLSASSSSKRTFSCVGSAASAQSGSLNPRMPGSLNPRFPGSRNPRVLSSRWRPWHMSLPGMTDVRDTGSVARLDEEGFKVTPESLSHVMSGCLDEEDFQSAICTVASWETSCPSVDMLKSLVTVIKQAESGGVREAALAVWHGWLDRFPPVTAALRDLFDQALGFSQWEAFRAILQDAIDAAGTVTVPGDSDPKSVCAGSTSRLILRLAISVLEKNFLQLVHNPSRAGRTKCLLVRCLWSPALQVYPNGRTADLMGFLETALKHLHTPQACWREVLRVVAMATQCCHLADNGWQWSAGGQLDRFSGPMVRDLAHAITGGGVDQVETLQMVLAHLSPPWLQRGVAATLLDEYDDYMVPGGMTSDPVTLHKIVTKYFFLLPKLSGINRSPYASPRKKVKRESKAMDENVAPPSGLTADKINKKNHKGENLLHKTATKNNISLLKQMLSVPGVDVNGQDFAGWTPLHEACNRGNMECVRALLKFTPGATLDNFFTAGGGGMKRRRVDLHLANEDGITALHDAVMLNHISVVKLLLKYGGSSLLKARTCRGLTALDLAPTEEMRQVLSRDSLDVSMSQDVFSQELDTQEREIVPSSFLYRAVLDSDAGSDPLSVSLGDSGSTKLSASLGHARTFLALLTSLLTAHVKVVKLQQQQQEKQSQQQELMQQQQTLSQQQQQQQMLVSGCEPKVEENVKFYTEALRRHMKKITSEEVFGRLTVQLTLIEILLVQLSS